MKVKSTTKLQKLGREPTQQQSMDHPAKRFQTSALNLSVIRKSSEANSVRCT